MAQTEDINMKLNLAFRHEIEVEVKALEEGAKLPAQARQWDAGYDLTSNTGGIIPAGEWDGFGTGLSVAIPEGYAGFIRPRSGLAARYGIDVLAGVIDSGYRGEIRVVLMNHGHADYVVNEGDRIAQLVIQPVASVTFTEVPALPESVRGEGGFGSTGVRL
jgi:dUTP pyrophosphatase